MIIIITQIRLVLTLKAFAAVRLWMVGYMLQSTSAFTFILLISLSIPPSSVRLCSRASLVCYLVFVYFMLKWLVPWKDDWYLVIWLFENERICYEGLWIKSRTLVRRTDRGWRVCISRDRDENVLWSITLNGSNGKLGKKDLIMRWLFNTPCTCNRWVI